jgi:hypothetical protein
MAFNLVLPQMLPGAKLLATFLAGILHAPLALLFRGPAICHVVANESFCNPDQAVVVAGRLYIDICIIVY